MIYKLKNGGIAKLKNKGKVPEYGDVEKIAAYNREHGTNFYKMSQVIEHDKQQAQKKSQDKKKTIWNVLATGAPESAGEAILNKTIETANNAELPETREGVYKDTGKKQLATTAGALLTLPMLGEFSTYGLLGGASRIAGGMAGSAVGSYALGKAGELGDRTFGTTWMKPTGQVIGGFVGWVPGSNIPTSLLRTAAGKGLTLHMPQETFTKLRGQYFDNIAKNIKLDNTTPWKLYNKDRLIKDYIEFGPDVNLLGDNVSKLIHWDPMTTGKTSALPINGGFDRKAIYFPHFENGKLVPAIGEIRSKLGNGQMYEHLYHPIFFGGNKPWWETPNSNLSDQYLKETTFNKSKFVGPKQYYDRWAKRERQHLRNLRNWYTKYGPQDKSDRYLITDPENLKDYEFNYRLGIMGSEVPMSKLEGFEYDPLLGTFKRARYVDPSIPHIIPQKSVSTVHFDPRVKPMSRPISDEAESVGMPKSMRNNYGLTDAQRKQVIADANDFAKKYGYSEINDSPEALQQIQDMYRRHNTFGRTISDPDEFFPTWHHFGEEHKGLTTQQRAKVAATEGYPYAFGMPNPQDRVFVSGNPSLLESYGASIQPTFAVRRRISLGNDPLKWRQRAEFELGDWAREMKPNEVRQSEMGMNAQSSEVMLGTGELSAKPLTSPSQLSGAFNTPVIESTPNWLQSQGFKLPRKHLQGDDAVKMFKEYGTKYPETTRLYRVTGTSGNFTPSPDGTAEFAGQWFTNDPNKVWWYGENAFKEARRARVENPIELQVVDIPTSQLEKFRAKNIIGDRKGIEFEPEDFIIPLETSRGRAPLNLTGNLLIDQKAGLPQIPTQDTPLMQQLRAYVPEARERYGLVGNTNITDDEIAGSLYKKVLDLGGDTAARNEVGEPLILFRGDTKRYLALKPRMSPEELATKRGTMDNSLGTLFLDFPKHYQGVDRYLGTIRNFNGDWEYLNSGTGSKVIGGSREFDPTLGFPKGTYKLYSGLYGKRQTPISVWKLPGSQMESGINDLNGFVVRTKSVRDATPEISVLNDDWLAKGAVGSKPHMKTILIEDENGVPLFKHPDGSVTEALAGTDNRPGMAEHYRFVLDDAKSKEQGLLWSRSGAPLRDEHTDYNYYALPNFNIRGAKHILPFDLRMPMQWGSRIIYRKQGGILKAQDGVPEFVKLSV